MLPLVDEVDAMALSTSCSFCRHYPLLEVYPMGKAVRCPTCGGELVITLSGARFRLDRERWNRDDEAANTPASWANPIIPRLRPRVKAGQAARVAKTQC